MSFSTNSNSIYGGYSGDSVGSISGSAHGNPITYTSPSGSTTITPSVSHSTDGSHHTLGGGATINHQFNDHVTGTAGVHHHGGVTSGTIGITIR